MTGGDLDDLHAAEAWGRFITARTPQEAHAALAELLPLAGRLSADDHAFIMAQVTMKPRASKGAPLGADALALLEAAGGHAWPDNPFHAIPRDEAQWVRWIMKNIPGYEREKARGLVASVLRAKKMGGA